jgi:MscS family membrane protein
VTLYYFGVDLTAALAGLGVGGIALALAAQKTLENVIAGASLIFDRTLNAGDTVKVGDSVGTIEDIGLRSTRIRTPGRTLVSVPNGQVASMTLENLSSRDKFWFHHILSLSYGTTSPQIHSVLTGIRGLLAESRQLEPTSLRVNFLRVGPGTLDVEVFAYVLAADWPQFLRTQEELLLRIIEFIESIEVHIAPPPNAMIAVASTSNDARLEPLKPATGWKSGGDVTPAKSA